MLNLKGTFTPIIRLCRLKYHQDISFLIHADLNYGRRIHNSYIQVDTDCQFYLLIVSVAKYDPHADINIDFCS